MDKQHRDTSTTIKANTIHAKVQYDKSFYPWLYVEGELVLLYDQDEEPPGAGNFKPMWHGPYIVQRVLKKGSYEL
jgi:hypothetical protein